MALRGDEPTPPLAPVTASVPARRRTAVVVAVVALLVVGTLVWKPWQGSGDAPASLKPSASRPAAVAATTPDPVSSHRPAPASVPSTAPPDDGIDHVRVPSELGSVDLSTSFGTAFVNCIYGASGRAQSTLRTMVVEAPSVVLRESDGGKAQAARVTYRPELEANALQSVFSADWVPVSVGDTQRRQPGDSLQVGFRPVQLSLRGAELAGTDVVRVALVITWLGDDGRRLGTQRVYPATYNVLGDLNEANVAEGCPATS